MSRSQRVTVASSPSIVPFAFGLALLGLSIFFALGIGSLLGGGITAFIGALVVGYRTFVRLDGVRQTVTWYGGFFFPMWRKTSWDFKWPVRLEVSFVRMESRGGLLEQEVVLEAANGSRPLLTCLTLWGAHRVTRRLARGLGLRRQPLSPMIVP